jgi:outer membrane lipoprotein-sorting protein
MRPTFSSLVVLGVLLLAVPRLALAQTADEIVEKHLAASGGREALGKLTSRTATGSISLTTPVGELMGTIEVYSKRPNKQRTVIKLDLTALGGGPIVTDQRFDGTTGYIMDPVNGNRTVEGPQLDAMRSGSFPSPLLNYKEIGASLTLSGREPVGGKETFVLRLTPKAGPPVRMFIDSTTFMLVRTVVTVNVPQLGGDIDQVVEFSDFRNVDGITVPFVTKSTNPVQSISATMTSVKHNEAIDDAAFAKP